MHFDSLLLDNSLLYSINVVYRFGYLILGSMVQRESAQQMVEANFFSLRLLLWFKKGFASLADQWLFSGTNFLANILLARWLPAQEYGAFALAFSIFLLLGALHTAVLTEPMLVLGGGRYRKKFSNYLSFLLAGHFAISLAALILLGAAAWGISLLGSSLVARALWGIALASPFILLPWLLRYAFYVTSKPGLAATGSGLYLLIVPIGIYWLHEAGSLSPMFAFLLMGAVSLVISIAFLSFLRPASLRGKADLRGMLSAQGEYAKWSGPSSILIWIPLNIFYVVLPYSAGLEGTAELRAVSNLLTPFIQSNVAITTLLLPSLSQTYAEKGRPPLLAKIKSIFPLFILGSIGYLFLLVIFRQPLLNLLYGDRYLHLSGVLAYAGIVPVLIGIAAVVGGGLRAMTRVRQIFTGYFSGAAAALSIGVILALKLGVTGAIIGQAISNFVICIAFAKSLFSRK